MNYCASCGTSNTAKDTFCVNCGFQLENQAVSVQVADTTTQKSKNPRKILKLVSIAAISLIAGVLATSNGMMEPIVGKRYTDSELKKAKTTAYESGKTVGYSSGKSDGYSSGQSDGYSTGFTAGCNHVFERVGYSDVIGISYPYYTSDVGSTYYTQSYTC